MRQRTGGSRGAAPRRAEIAGKVVALAGLLALGACESSARLGSLLPGSRPAPRAALPPQPAAPPPLVAAPDEDVESAPLPPLGGAPPPVAPLPPSPPTAGPAGVGTAPGNLPPVASTPAAPPSSTLPAPRVATAPAPTPGPAATPSRTGLTGNWSVSEAAGNRCRITLSSAPKLDLYAAGTSGCQSRDLQRVNAWELAGNEVILYEPGGDVAARLRPAGGGSYAGVATKSGAPITLSK